MLRLLFKSFFLIIFFNFIFTNIPSKNNHNILNDAPVLDFIPGQNIDEDTEFNYTLSATDNDLDALTFQVSINGNGNASITGQNNLEITPNLTKVTSILEIERADYADKNAPLVLNGELLTLISVKINDQKLIYLIK